MSELDGVWKLKNWFSSTTLLQLAFPLEVPQISQKNNKVVKKEEEKKSKS